MPTPDVADRDQAHDLKLFVALDAKVAASRKSMAEIDAVKELEKRTGIKIEFLHPGATRWPSRSTSCWPPTAPRHVQRHLVDLPRGFAKLYNAGQIIDVAST
jgi:hypothetical protein